jgi:Uma2 family endonuclease
MTIVDRPASTEQRFLTSTDWEGYLHALKAFKGRHIKITFDGGRLELLTTSFLHEAIKSCLRQLLETAFFELAVENRPAGATTFRNRLKEQGLEPDECYFLSQFPRPEGYDPEGGQWPDLALEIEVTRSALDRLGIYRGLGVREVWRYSADHQLRIESLQGDAYQAVEESTLLPGLKVAELPGFVQLGLEKGSNTMLRAFKTWLASEVNS